jgi:biotin carboxylase
MRLYLVASKPTDAVTHGFLPAAARLGLDVTVLTDRPAAHASAYADRPVSPPLTTMSPPLTLLSPSLADGAGYPVPRIEYCEVTDHRALIAALGGMPAADGLFSNSDRLQVQTALAAASLELPGKDWWSALCAKRKPLMRSTLARAGIERVRFAKIGPGGPEGNGPGGDETAEELPYPVVLKPADGVASEDVVLAEGPEQFREFRDDYFRRHAGGSLMAEEFLAGTLRTMETLGDGVTRWVLGGFRTSVSKPPFFAEERLDWDPPASTGPAGGAREHVEAALDALGVSFGACHTEYVSGGEYPVLDGKPALDGQPVLNGKPAGETARLIEVNDRVIGDHCEFLLAHLTGLPLFELILTVHLGERLPKDPPAQLSARVPGHRHAVADYVFADGPGLLSRVPPAARFDRAGVTLTHWPLRRTGDEIAVTGTNRDYLGVICAAGPDPAAVDDAVRELRGSLAYQIRSRAAI